MAKPVAKAVKPVPAAPAAEAPDGAKAQSKGGSKKTLVMLLLGTLALGGAGAGGWFYFGGGGGQSQNAPRPASVRPPVFVNLEPFTVNLQPESGADQYLQAVAVLRVADDKTSETLKQYMPELRHKTLLLLSGKKAAEIATPEGREKLAEEMRSTVNQLLATATGKTARGAAAPIKPAPAPVPGAKPPEQQPVFAQGADEPVQGVLFTSFIIQ